MPTTILLNQQAVQPAVVAKRTYNIARISDQSIPTHQVQVVKFLLHALIFLRQTKTTLTITSEKLPGQLYITMLLFIQVHFIAPSHAKDTKCCSIVIEPYLGQYIIL